MLPSNKEEPLARALAELGESTWKDIGELGRIHLGSVGKKYPPGN